MVALLLMVFGSAAELGVVCTVIIWFGCGRWSFDSRALTVGECFLEKGVMIWTTLQDEPKENKQLHM